MNHIKEALELYEELKDMDYLETYADDIEYIADLLKTRTCEDVITLLTE